MSIARSAAILVALGAGCGGATSPPAVPEPFLAWNLPIGEGRVAASSDRAVVVVYERGDRDALVTAWAAALAAAGCMGAAPVVVDTLAIATCRKGDDVVTWTAGSDGQLRLVVGLVRAPSARQGQSGG